MEHISVEISNRIAVVTIERPPVNAFSHQTFSEIAEAFRSLDSGRDASVAILRAAPGSRVFCGGVDLKDSPKRYRADGRFEDGGSLIDARYQVDAGRVVRECFWSIYEGSVPVIAAVDGAVIGAGTALLGCCDLLVASERATFALTEINVGVLGGARHAQRLVGPFLSKRMFLTGEAVSAQEMYRRGAIEAVVPVEELMDAAFAIARPIAAKSPIAVRLAKESANRVEALSLQDGYRVEQDYTNRVKRHADSEEARLAFVEKREATFRWE
jgi:enoyl-CoA hydratase